MAVSIEKIREAYVKTDGKGWEPPNPSHPQILDLLKRGYVRRTDGRCGFELMKDVMVVWTEAAHLAFAGAAFLDAFLDLRTFENENPNDCTKRWDDRLYAREAAEVAFSKALAARP